MPHQKDRIAYKNDVKLKKTVDTSVPDEEKRFLSLPLSIEKKRQILYSSLLRYSSEAVPLRERALDRVAIGALFGSTEEDPFRIGQIQKNLQFGPSAPVIRIETIQETLARLKNQGKVEHTRLRKKYAYYLTEGGNEEFKQIIENAESLLTNVLKEHLKDTEYLLSSEVAADVFIRFIFESFARFGQIIAKNVTGLLKSEDLINSMDTEDAFKAAIQNKDLSDEAIQSLKARCSEFLKSSDPNDEKLKFQLTQGFYFTQLLGIEEERFNPLTDLAFSDAIFYLDTNVLLIGLLQTEKNIDIFDEIIRITQRIGIELRVSKATIDEAHCVAIEHMEHINKFFDVLPDELMQRTEDDFLVAFLKAREKDESITPEEFIEPFYRLSEILQEKWNIIIDYRTAVEIIDGRDFSHAANVINREAEEGRGWGKSEVVLEHDVCHYALIIDERCKDKKIWFLSKDNTLSKAATKLAGKDQPFSFSMIGFLHSISPFVTTAKEEDSFVDIFSTIFTKQLITSGPLFKTSELALLAEFHEDVLATPTDKLIMALDYIKSHTLKGRRYNQSDIPRVSLELKTFLSSSKDEQVKALEDERARLEAEKAVEIKKRRSAEELARQHQADKQTLRDHIELLRASDIEKQEQIDDMKEDLEEQKRRFTIRKRRTWLLGAIIGIILGMSLWVFDNALISALSGRYPNLAAWAITVFDLLLKVFGLLIFTFPAFMFIRLSTWIKEIKLVIFIVVIVGAIAFSHLIDNDTLSIISTLIGVATLIATALKSGLNNSE